MNLIDLDLDCGCSTAPHPHRAGCGMNHWPHDACDGLDPREPGGSIEIAGACLLMLDDAGYIACSVYVPPEIRLRREAATKAAIHRIETAMQLRLVMPRKRPAR